MIARLSLRNFKAFRSVDLNLGSLSLLTGGNATGKSTILQSLAALRQSADSGTLQGEGLLLNSELVELGAGRDVLHEAATEQEISVGMLEDGVARQWKFAYSPEADLLTYAQVGDAPSVPPIASFLFHEFQLLRADRVAPAVSYPRSYSNTVRRRFLGARGEYTAHFLARHQDSMVRDGRALRVEGLGQNLGDQVCAWLAQISPGAFVTAEEIAGTDFARLWYSIGGRAGRSGSNPYRPTNVGFGLTYCLPVIVGCLSSPPGGTVALENPEAHIHPSGQVCIGELLARTAAGGVQVIVESHSDHVLNGIRLAVRRGVIDADAVRIHYFERESPERETVVTSPTISREGRLSHWPRGFFDQWEDALIKLTD